VDTLRISRNGEIRQGQDAARADRYAPADFLLTLNNKRERMMTDIGNELSPQVSELPTETSNPHSLWKQLIVLIVFSIIFGFFGSPLVILPGIFVFIDAWKSGIYKDKERKAFLNLSPAAWGVAMEGLLIITYPLYLINRKKLKKRESGQIYYVLTILSGGIVLLLLILKGLSRMKIL
jgi:hypothetical protein